MTNNINHWKKYHRFQEKEGWCGPAVIQMILGFCGIEKNQTEIAKDVYLPWWGTNQQILVAYLSKFFSKIGFFESANFDNISEHLNRGHLIIVDWWDDFTKKGEGGHYSIVGDFDPNTKKLTFIDPSNERGGIWTLSSDEFKSKWYDTLDVHDKIRIEGWMLWVDPESKI